MLLPLQCRRIAPSLWGYLAAELDPHTGVEVAHHLDSCGTCRAQLARIEEVCELLRTCPPDKPMPAAVRGRLAPLLVELEADAAADASPFTRTCANHWLSRHPR